jgi:hypothetical protein
MKTARNTKTAKTTPPSQGRRVWPAWVVAALIVAGAGALAMRGRGHHRAMRPSRATEEARAEAMRAAPTTETVPETWTKARAKVADMLRTEPERLSPHAAARPFDQASFDNDPEAYLSEIEPSRCYQTATPGQEVPRLSAPSGLRTELSGDEPAILWIVTAPNAPVTYTAFTGGFFTENGISSVSVRADARGLASAHFRADRGAEGDLMVIAGSPLASGMQQFRIRARSLAASL